MSINTEEPQPIDAEKAETTVIEKESDTELQRLRDENAALHKMIDSAKQIADEMDDAQRDEDDLKARAKKAKERKDTLADSLAHLVKGDAQTEIGEFKKDGDLEGQESIPWTPEELEKRKESGDAIELQQGMIAWADLEVAALDRLTDTNKPQQLKPVVLFGKPYVCTGIDKRIVTLIPALDTVAWGELYPTLVPMDRPNDDQLEELAAHGKLAGIPVKCEMSKSKKGKPVYQLHHLAGDAQALLVKMPEDAKRKAEPEVLSLGEQDDTGHQVQEDQPRDLGVIANRITKELEAAIPDYCLTVAGLCKIIGVSSSIIINAIERSDNIELDKLGENSDEWGAVLQSFAV